MSPRTVAPLDCIPYNDMKTPCTWLDHAHRRER
jgi:hypothetical protein